MLQQKCSVGSSRRPSSTGQALGHGAVAHIPKSGQCAALGSMDVLLGPAPVVARQQPFRPATHSARGRAALRPCAAAKQVVEPKSSIAITGATGLVGSRLVSKLASQGYKVRVLTRNVSSAQSKMPYPGLTFHAPSKWADAIRGCDAVINLAGEPIGTRWTSSIKREIKTSRLGVTNAIVSAIAACPPEQRPKVLVSSSAVGFYGASQSASFTEDSPSGNDYLAEICREWEAAAQKVPAGVRTVIVRTGLVLAREGGVIAKMLPIFELFAGGPLGSGKQWVSWIHRDDLVDLMVSSLTDASFSGVYNGTAPKPVTMAQLCSAVGGVLGRPSWLPVPDFAITTLLGEGAQVVLDGQKVLPSRAQQQGFSFRYTEVGDALRSILK